MAAKSRGSCRAGRVARVVANRHLFAHIGGEGEVQIAEALEVDAVLADLAGFGHGEQQQVELLQRFRELWEEPPGLPARLRRLARFAMHALLVVVHDEALQAPVQLGDGEHRFRDRRAGRGVAGERAEEELIDRLEEALDAAAAAWLPLGRKVQHDVQVGGDLLEVARGEVAAVVGIELLRDAADVPGRVSFVPDSLMQGDAG